MIPKDEDKSSGEKKKEGTEEATLSNPARYMLMSPNEPDPLRQPSSPEINPSTSFGLRGVINPPPPAASDTFPSDEGQVDDFHRPRAKRQQRKNLARWEDIIGSFRKWNLPHFTRDFFSTLGNYHPFTLDVLKSFLASKIARGEFNVEDFIHQRYILLNTEILHLFFIVFDYEEGGKSPWPYLPENLGFFLRNFWKVSAAELNNWDREKEGVFSVLSFELNMGEDYILKWTIPIEIFYQDVLCKIDGLLGRISNKKNQDHTSKIMRIVTLLFEIREGYRVIWQDFSIQRFPIANLDIDLFILDSIHSKGLVLYLYDRTPLGTEWSQLKLSQAKKFWTTLKSYPHLSININPRYSPILAPLIARVDDLGIPDPIMKQIVMPILSLPCSKLRDFYERLPPILEEQKDQITEIFLRDYQNLQKAHVISQIRTILRYFNPPGNSSYTKFYSHLKKNLGLFEKPTIKRNSRPIKD